MSDDDVKRLYEKLDHVLEEVGAIREEIAKYTAQCENCRKNIEHLNSAVHGSNGDGLKTRMSTAEVRLNKISKDFQWHRATMLSFLTAIAGWAVTIWLALK